MDEHKCGLYLFRNFLDEHKTEASSKPVPLSLLLYPFSKRLMFYVYYVLIFHYRQAYSTVLAERQWQVVIFLHIPTRMMMTMGISICTNLLWHKKT